MNSFWNSSFKSQQASSSSGSSGTKEPLQVNDSLFELHKPPGTPQMQVLFFHGLQLEDSSDMHMSTWNCGDGSSWPQTWLVEKFPGAHVLSVSYNGRMERNSQGILDMYLVGENLTSDFLQADIGQMLDCPVIMVGHSFGGLVIKQLYCQAHHKLHMCQEGDAKYKLKKFLGNIRGIFYYATPHHGSMLVEKMAKAEANPLLEYFQTLSTKGARLNSDFDQIRRQYGKVDIFGLGEGLKRKLRGFREDMVVSEASSRVENFYTVSGVDHYSICRPENETSASFSKLTTFLDNIATDAEAEAKNRKEAKEREENRFDNFQHLPESIVGIEVPVHAVIAKLDTAPRVGIVGMGGLGKTTLAKALFNIMGPQFEYSCFVLEVKNIHGSEDDVKEKVWEMMHRHGKKVGKEDGWSSLRGKRLFLVLDDISDDRDFTVLSSIVKVTSGESRFIVTSRNQQLLGTLDDVFNVCWLDEGDARQLFSSHAFSKEEEPSLEVENLMTKIVRKCDGLPLALEVVGKSLYRRVDQEDWKQTLHALVQADNLTDLNEKLWKKLRVSYDRLTEEEKKVFLDVTTFFSGNYHWTLRDAKAAWRVAYDTKTERLLWQTLVDLSLVYSVAEDGTIKVHEQLQSLGRKIASEQRQRRIWEGSAGLCLLQKTNDLDEEAIFSLRLDEKSTSNQEKIHIASGALQRLREVHYLEVDRSVPIIIDGGQGCEPLPTKLVLLHCGKPQLSRILLHSNLRKSLVGLRLWDLEDLRVPKNRIRFRYSRLRFQRPAKTNSGLTECMLWSTTNTELAATAPIERVLHEIGRFSQLEVLRLIKCPCQSLPETFGQLTKLRSLLLDDFDDLCKLPNSFGQLKALSHLQFRNCRKLDSLPESFGLLKALSSLLFLSCSNLHSLPDSFGELSSLNELCFNDCPELNQLPESFGQLKTLSELRFLDCKKLDSLPESFGLLKALTLVVFFGCSNFHSLPESFGQLKTLSYFTFQNCEKLLSLPDSFGELSSLKYVCFLGCKFDNLPESFGQLKSLNDLRFVSCSKLRSLPNSFGNLSSLNRLEFYSCEELDNLPESFQELRALNFLKFQGCEKLHTLPEGLSYLKFRQVKQNELEKKTIFIASRSNLEDTLQRMGQSTLRDVWDIF